MRDDTNHHHPSDRGRLDLEESWELRWLTQELGVNEEELPAAISAAGLVVSQVKQHLGHP
jgi:hypothetical protein